MKSLPAIVYWTARLLAALIMLQTLFFKFTASSESVYIFTTVGMEPWGRIMVGVLELIASVMLLINRIAWMGALLGLGLMSGAIVMHLAILGISVQDDGGQLFTYALLVSACSVLVLIIDRVKIIRKWNILFPSLRVR
ncbi:MAG: DoxX family membrane protein [Cyclobacteriaceae bacterium]